MEITEAIKLKEKLEDNIKELLEDFQNQTTLIVNDININNTTVCSPSDCSPSEYMALQNYVSIKIKVVFN